VSHRVSQYFYVVMLIIASLHSTVHAASLTTQLRVQDQRLLIAVHNGGRELWDRLTTSDFTYVEEGEIQTKRDFLKDLEPDHSQPLVIRDYTVRVMGDTALVVHHDDIPSRGLSQRPSGQYLMTEVWQFRDGQWKLRIVHVDAVRSDPPSIILTSAELDELTGVFGYDADRFTIRREGSQIFGRRSGQREAELKAETRDVLFTPGQPRLRRVFERDVRGRVIGFIRRDENTDVEWKRMD